MKYLSIIIIWLMAFHATAQSTEILPGAVLPQMTTAQRTGLANPVNGMLVYDTGTNSYWFRQGTAWVELPKGGSTSNYWELSGLGGNEIKNTNSGGFWSANATTVPSNADNISNPPTAPVNGNGTHMMWIPSRSAFRVGTVNDNSKAWDADSIGLYSFAAGLNSKGIGENSIAIGRASKAGFRSIAIGTSNLSYNYFNTAIGVGNTATGFSSMAIGWECISTGGTSTAIGNYNRATGDGAMALGNYSFASGSNSVAIGNNVAALGSSSFSAGYYSKAKGLNSIALGELSEAIGQSSTSMGVETKALFYASTALGYRTKSKNDYAFSSGRETQANAPHSFSIGAYNDTTDIATFINEVLPNDRLFQIGNGGDDNSRSNALTVLRNGNIGTYNVLEPKANLHLQYNSSLNWDAHLRLQYDADDWGNIVYDFDGFKFRTFGANDDFIFRNAVGSGTQVARIFHTGNMTIAGTLTQNSDLRLKTNLTKVQNSGTKLAQLQAYHYNWKAADSDPSLQTGLIAQEVQMQFPELVNEGENGYLSVNYIGLIPHLIESQKELKAENEMLKERLLKIEQKLENHNQSQTASLR